MPRKPSNESRDIRYLKDMIAALPAEIQMMNRCMDQNLFLQSMHDGFDKEHVDILVFDVDRSNYDRNEFYVYSLDVKQISNIGGQFPREFKENTIIFETKGRNGSLGWGLHTEPQNRYIAMVDGYGWELDVDSLCNEFKTADEIKANLIQLKEQVIQKFARTPGQLNHRYYLFDLQGLQAFYYKHESDYDLMPLGRYSGEGSEYRKIPLSHYAKEGFGYSFWEWDMDHWNRTTDDTVGEKPPKAGKLSRNLFTGREITSEEIPCLVQNLQEALAKQQEKYALQIKAYADKGYASKTERVDYLRIKEVLRTQDGWLQSKLSND